MERPRNEFIDALITEDNPLVYFTYAPWYKELSWYEAPPSIDELRMVVHTNSSSRDTTMYVQNIRP